MYPWLRKNLKGDPVIWGVVILLSFLSVFLVYSATGALAMRKMGGFTEFYLFKHLALLIAGLVVMLLLHRTDYRYLRKASLVALIITIPLLLIALVSAKINGASRWLEIPLLGQAFQPSDIAKLALITYVASELDRKQQNLYTLEALLPLFGWIGFVCGTIALTNFSTAVLLLLTCLLLMLIAGVSAKYMALLGMGAGVLGVAAFMFGQRGATFLHRLQSFISPDDVPFQAQQAYIAIAHGGIFGQGPGNSFQKDFLPHPYSDFIYAILVEEWGLVGGLVVLLAYLLLLYRGMVAVARSQNAFGALLSAGFSFSLAIQAMLNMAVAVGLAPITGQPLPMLSMGGSSLLSTGAMLGLILSVSRGTAAPAAYAGPNSPRGTPARAANTAKT